MKVILRGIQNIVITVGVFTLLLVVFDNPSDTYSSTSSDTYSSEYRNLNATMNSIMADDRVVRGWSLDGNTLKIALTIPYSKFKIYGFDESYKRHLTNNTIVNKVVFVSQ